jgi:hypothetical protein
VAALHQRVPAVSTPTATQSSRAHLLAPRQRPQRAAGLRGRGLGPAHHTACPQAATGTLVMSGTDDEVNGTVGESQPPPPRSISRIHAQTCPHPCGSSSWSWRAWGRCRARRGGGRARRRWSATWRRRRRPRAATGAALACWRPPAAGQPGRGRGAATAWCWWPRGSRTRAPGASAAAVTRTAGECTRAALRYFMIRTEAVPEIPLRLR